MDGRHRAGAHPTSPLRLQLRRRRPRRGPWRRACTYTCRRRLWLWLRRWTDSSRSSSRSNSNRHIIEREWRGRGEMTTVGLPAFTVSGALCLAIFALTLAFVSPLPSPSLRKNAFDIAAAGKDGGEKGERGGVTLPTPPPGVDYGASRVGDGAGRGMFATRAFKEDEVVFTETAYFASHDVKATPACSRCLAPILPHSFEAELEIQSGTRIRPKNLADGYARPPAWSLPPLPEGTPECPCPVLCRRGCGEMYCSLACEAKSFGEYHSILCPGLGLRRGHPLMMFRNHLVDSEMTDASMGARFVAFAMLRARRFLEATKDKKDGGTGAGQTADAMRYALGPFLPYNRPIWTEVMGYDEKVKKEGKEIREQTARGMHESAILLREALLPYTPKGLELLLDEELYLRFMGMLHQYSFGVELPSPLRTHVEALNRTFPLRTKKQRKKLLAAWAEHVSPLLKAIRERRLNRNPNFETDGDEQYGWVNPPLCEEDEGVAMEAATDEVLEDFRKLAAETEVMDWLFCPVVGSAMARAAWCINHSCDSNCNWDFKWQDGGKGLHVEVTAARNISAGEELTISYIGSMDLARPAPERQRKLASYDFVCRCSRCVEEEDEHGSFVLEK
mmetsp:Transcript_29806/g.58201  ORF Transcript_29806/g.58201 Transcript_29806/m.58201 type:complete len:618 (+) Transcript_29806:666-2519(+)